MVTYEEKKELEGTVRELKGTLEKLKGKIGHLRKRKQVQNRSVYRVKGQPAIPNGASDDDKSILRAAISQVKL